MFKMNSLVTWVLLSAAAGLLRAQTKINLNEFLQPNRVTREQYRDGSLCARNCAAGEPPKICYYKFITEDYVTMGPACGNCPTNVTDCAASQCVVADGIEKSIRTFNRMVPGPSIEVCLGDRILVDVSNNMGATEFTVHWHGLFQRGTQYMDGVPTVTQCPIHEGTTFRYDFFANNPGTHYYHSHTGLTKLDGLQGTLIVRSANDSNRNTYTVDDPEHVIILLDWVNTTAEARYPGLYNGQVGQEPSTFLPQGQGPAKPGISNIPYKEFWVHQGEQYRFRLIGALCTVCGVEVRIENHDMLLIAADGANINPVSVSAVILFSGERYDVVVDANQTPGTYWMHFRGLGECETPEIYQLALLRYFNTNQTRPDVPDYLPDFIQGTVANPLNASCGANQSGVCVSQLQGSLPDTENVLNSEPTISLIFEYGFHIFPANRRQDLFNNGQYKRYMVGLDKNTLTSWINNISTVITPSPILSQNQDIPESAYCPINPTTGYPYCPANSTDDICLCAYVIKIPYGANVQCFLSDATPRRLHHAFHLHGYNFFVMGMDQYRDGETPESVSQRMLTERRSLPPARKDTITVPTNGWAAIRFRASNPGAWFFHCHFLFHVATGMGVVFQIGEPHNWPPVPPNFPKCHEYKPDVFIKDYNSCSNDLSSISC